MTDRPGFLAPSILIWENFEHIYRNPEGRIVRNMNEREMPQEVLIDLKLAMICCVLTLKTFIHPSPSSCAEGSSASAAVGVQC